jgi:uncharacterized protein YdeI (YjbR/CyaY-like superfamily)
LRKRRSTPAAAYLGVRRTEKMLSKGWKLKRKRQPMPAFVKEALREANLFSDYCSRPEYQQNDYLGWINQAKKEETKRKRLRQMLEELKKGGVYMNMAHPASAKE